MPLVVAEVNPHALANLPKGIIATPNCTTTRTACTIFFSGMIQEFQLYFCGGKCHTIEFKITGLLHNTIHNGYMRNDGLADVGLPYPNRGHTVFRYAARIH